MEVAGDLDIDKLLKSAGDSGVYQITLFALVGILVFVTIDSFAINFLAGKMNHWCQVPGLETFDHAEQFFVGVPAETVGLRRHTRCQQYPHDLTSYSMDEIALWNHSTVGYNVTRENWETCTNWTYDKSVFVSTIVSEWDLVCDRSWLIDLISTIFMGGRLVACLSCGPISDRFGRKPTVLVFHGIKMIGSIMCIYAPNYIIYVVARCLVAFGSTGSSLAVFVILSEVTGESWRHIFGIGWNLVLTFGIIALPAVAYFVRDYVYLQMIYAWPQLVLFIYIWLLDESPRWLMSCGRTRDALKVLRKIAAVNRRHLPESPEIHTLKQSQVKKTERSRPSIREMLSTPVLRMRSFILWLNWFTDALMYYALMLNTGYLPGDIFLNSFLLTIVELPANFLTMFLLGRIGRRLTLGTATILSGVTSIIMIPLMYFPGDGFNTAITVLAIIGKGFITIAYSAVYIVTAETYPTRIRNIGMGVSSSFGRLSGMGASFIGGSLSELWRPLPCVVFGVLGTVSGGLAFLLPETMNEKLPETILDAENIGKGITEMSVACDDAADGAAGMEEQKRKEIQQDVEEDLQMPLTEEKQLDSKQLDSKV